MSEAIISQMLLALERVDRMPIEMSDDAREQLMDAITAGRGALVRKTPEVIAEASDLIEQVSARMELEAELRTWRTLQDPATLHANLLRGFPARLSRDMLLHIAGDGALEQAARIAELEAALALAVYAMRAPLDGWKGEVERVALDAARRALAQEKT